MHYAKNGPILVYNELTTHHRIFQNRRKNVESMNLFLSFHGTE